MLEAAADARHRDAILAAHAARGRFVSGLWKSVFARRR